MATGSFVHLHCHTHYSLLDGASRVPELVAHTKAQGMNAVAITDHGNLYGAIEFYRECKSAGINPIVGYEAYVAPTTRFDREAKKRGDAGFHLTLLAQNRIGFQNLIKMASIAFLEGYYYVPRIDKDVLAAHKEGIICLSGCASAEFSEHILKGNMEEAEKLADWFAQLFGKNFYVEIQNNNLQVQRICAEGAIDIARKKGLPLVATSDAHYLCRADSAAHDVLLCINTGAKRSEVKRMRYEDDNGRVSDQFYVRSPEEMYKQFPDLPDAVQRSQEIADSVHIDLDFKARHFPVFTPPPGKTPEDYLRDLCEEGFRERYGDNPSAAARARLDHELGVICRMGFASYFLIVGDFVRFAVANKIPCSARGSGCGAVVSYVLKLSHVDPLEYDLLFERFLDPNRAEAPDIDIDFCQHRREEVIAYVKQKYGEQSVAQIATFGTLAARAAIKDVGRVLDVPLERVNQLTAMIPTTLGITIDEALEQSPDFKNAYETDPLVHELLDIARKLEGTNRNAGTHAAGVVISNGPLMDYVPLQKVVRKGDDAGSGKTRETAITTQWVMGDIEKVGMLKMDFLGLRTLTLVEECLKLIKQNRGQDIDVFKLPLDDQPTYKLLQRGDAKGVFQFESDGIRELLKRLKPDNIRDIIACTALYRPGPLQGGMVDAYVNRKHGLEKPDSPHPVVEEILRETFGIMVYQESIMRILNRLGGIELASAYACIKAISKKKKDIIDQRHGEFIKGSIAQGMDKAVAQDIWDKIVFFAGYGFNKSHSAAYALVSYQTAYLKQHYTAEFMAALLSSEIDDGNKRDIMVDHISDARKMGIEVLPPCVNASDAVFSVQGNKSIIFGLLAIKGLGQAAAAEIVRARKEGGAFKDIFDFCERVDSKSVPRAAMEKLVKAGAMDRFGGHRAQLLHALPRASQAASEKQQDKRVGQGNLFETFDATGSANGTTSETLPDVPAWPESEKLKYEKEALDFYFSSHPLAQHEKQFNRMTTHTVSQIPTVQGGHEVTVGGILTQVRFMNTKKARNGNSRYLRCKLEDMTGTLECVMWPDDFARNKEPVQDDKVCFFKGVIDERSSRSEPIFLVSQIIGMEQMQREACGEIWLKLRLGEHAPILIDTLGSILKRTPGTCPVWLSVYDPTGKRAALRLGRNFYVNPLAFLPGEIEDLLGPGSVKLVAGSNGNRNGR